VLTGRRDHETSPPGDAPSSIMLVIGAFYIGPDA
jgi:hypothetical protein